MIICQRNRNLFLIDKTHFLYAPYLVWTNVEATLMIRDSIHWMVNIVQVPDSPIGIECSSTMFTKSSDPPFSGRIQVPCPILSGIKFSNTLDSSRSGT